MSRCFPYPPPGYTLKRNSEDALIESIKLQKEREKVQRKKDKRERKEKRKEKKDRAPRIQKTEVPKGKFFETEDKAEAEERSSLTEEHGEPVTLHVPSSSEGTENNKRKRDSSPVERPRTSGNVFRLRLSSKKLNEPVSSANIEEPCSTSGRNQNEPSSSTNLPECPSTSRMASKPFLHQNSQDLDRTAKRPRTVADSSRIGQILQFKTGVEKRLSTLSQIGTADVAKTEAVAPLLEAVPSKRQKPFLQYKDLIENWVPPPLHDPQSDGMDWLFQSNDHEVRRLETRPKLVAVTPPCCNTSSSNLLWPLAQLLPEIGVYALPYTVPF